MQSLPGRDGLPRVHRPRRADRGPVVQLQQHFPRDPLSLQAVQDLLPLLCVRDRAIDALN